MTSEIAPPRSLVYRTIATRAARRLLGALNRDELSPVSGSFDREYWAWKFRDYPLTMLQSGMVPLADLQAGAWTGNPFAGSDRLRSWIVAALWRTVRMQHRNGSFDSVAPFTQDHGVTLAMAHTVATTVQRLGRSTLPDNLVDASCETVRRACQFAARSSEDYAFISNHHALFALAWLRASKLLGEDGFATRSDEVVAQILAHQSSEGWYPEYGGPDAGYESLGISYLSEYDEDRPTPAVGASLRRAVEFLSYAIHPDGGVGGIYGSRFTSLWYPSGCERLAAADPRAARAAAHVAARLDASQVVTPDTVDINNLPQLLWSYLRAADYCDRQSSQASEAGGARAALPAEAFQGIRVFAESGLIVAGTPHYYAVFNGSRGGVGVVHSRRTGAQIHQDAGYVLVADGKTWTSALPPGRAAPPVVDASSVRLESQFGRALDAQLTPVRFLALRILNLTVFRSLTLARAITRIIVARLLTQRSAGPVTLSRQIDFGANRITFRDSLRSTQALSITRLVRARGFLPSHMGSAGYFAAADLDAAPATLETEAARALATPGQVTLSQEIVVDPASG